MAGGIAVNVLTSIFFLALIMGDRSVAAFVSATHLQYLQYRRNGRHLAIGRTLQGRRHWADLARIGTVAGMILLNVI
ncbi:hypothetical protein J6524_08855 [Bradyrhizobium sp. WSM 1738]|uniref:hypothetical protein n=1 Tax=Bradyrhizobium hereditatis TaxID=2821405 RepID=UPI001CE31FD1|nr:hypothetical protein [Bradyrhizobium hereditatis]MCA6115018.1 hypothetical protein [Bradyrhizobium hereditatis]